MDILKQHSKSIADLVCRYWPDVSAIYLFGSMAQENARPDSDVDLAVLSVAKPQATDVAELKMQLSALLRKDIDLVDLMRSDAVTAVQVIHGSLYVANLQPEHTANFEVYAFSRYALLNEERREILADIEQRGSIYG